MSCVVSDMDSSPVAGRMLQYRDRGIVHMVSREV